MTERTYRDLCPQGTPEAVRRKHTIGDIFLNQAFCLLCGDVITSNHRHDFVTCSCGNLSVDGGSWYAKRLFSTTTANYEEMSVYYTDTVAEGV